MRVAFVYARCVPTDGGVYNFVSAVGAGLKRVKTVHEFEFVSYGSPIEADFVWFLTPHFSPVNAPFAMTVWDLGHRVLPEFPEVSLSGWRFEEREAFYSGVLPRASLIVASNYEVRLAIHEFYRIPLKRILALNEPVSPLPEPDLSILEKHGLTKGKYLFYPAQFWPHKNHITVIEALAMMPDMKLVFTGADKGNQPYVMDYARQKYPEDQIIFAGFVERAQIAALYGSAYGTITAPLLEAYSLPAAEAASVHCPVFSVDLEPKFKRVEIFPYSADEYAASVVIALDRMAKIRRLWGKAYAHL